MLCCRSAANDRLHRESGNVPHFHAKYETSRVVIGLSDLAVLRGGLPPRALGLVMEWAVQHRGELLENWTRSTARQPLKAIAPLE